jgi:O-antigen/teichoic acid export membrane protein
VAAFGVLGCYAAARRVTLALLAVGLVVPTAIAPGVARAWLIGREETRILIHKGSTTLMLTAWPATVGLAMTADRWMPLLFGERYREGGPWLALLVARTPFILESNVQQAVLIACRREREALCHVGLMMSVAALLLPLAAVLDGPRSVGLVMLAIEAGGAIAGARALANLGLAPARGRDVGAVLAGCAGMTLVCGLGHAWPLPSIVIMSVFVYSVILVLLSRPEWFTWSRGRART